MEDMRVPRQRNKQYPLHTEIQAFKVIALFGSFVTWTIKHIWFGKLYTWGFTIFHVLVKGFEIYWILPSVGPDNGSLESLPIVSSLLVEVSPGLVWCTVCTMQIYYRCKHSHFTHEMMQSEGFIYLMVNKLVRCPRLQVNERQRKGKIRGWGS